MLSILPNLKRIILTIQVGIFIIFRLPIIEWKKLFEMASICLNLFERQRKTQPSSWNMTKDRRPKFDVWDEEDPMIMSWIWDSMNLEISELVCFRPLPKQFGNAFNKLTQKLEMQLEFMRSRSELVQSKKETKL